MKKAVILIAFALGGCVSVRPVQAPVGALDGFKGQPLTAVTYVQPDFSAMTYGKAAFGLIGAGLMISEGNAIIKDNGVEDPAIRIAGKLSARVAEHIQAPAPVRIAARPAKQDDEASLSRDAGRKGVVLDVETVNWMFSYFPLDWSHYRLMYVGRARLIDAASGKRIAQAPCIYKSDDQIPPTYDQMLADQAALLKTMLAAASDHCAEEMARGLYAQ